MSEMAQLTCQELVEVVTAYFEDALAPAERARFEAHLRVCAPCRHYLEQLRETIQLTGALAEATIAPEIQQDLLSAFRAWKHTSPPA